MAIRRRRSSDKEARGLAFRQLIQHVHLLKPKTQTRLASLAGVTARTVRNWMTGETVPTSKAIARLERNLQLEPGTFQIYWDNVKRDAREHYNRPPLDPFEHDTPLAMWQSDRKTVITNPAVSEQLLAAMNSPGLGMPSLTEVVRHSQMVLVDTDPEKDRPLRPALPYNHFVSVTGVLRVHFPEAGIRFVLYPRTPTPGRDHHKHTGGNSLLWACSYAYRVTVAEALVVTRWMSEVANAHQDKRQGAARTFVEFPLGPFWFLLGQKFPAVHIPTADNAWQAESMGVVTVDQRERPRPEGGKYNRVYTQYVFLAQAVAPPRVQVEELTRSCREASTQSDVFLVLPTELTRERFFDNDKRRYNLMDIVVAQYCRAVAENRLSCSTQESGEGERAVFVASDFLK